MTDENKRTDEQDSPVAVKKMKVGPNEMQKEMISFLQQKKGIQCDSKNKEIELKKEELAIAKEKIKLEKAELELKKEEMALAKARFEVEKNQREQRLEAEKLRTMAEKEERTAMLDLLKTVVQLRKNSFLFQGCNDLVFAVTL